MKRPDFDDYNDPPLADIESYSEAQDDYIQHITHILMEIVYNAEVIPEEEKYKIPLSTFEKVVKSLKR